MIIMIEVGRPNHGLTVVVVAAVALRIDVDPIVFDEFSFPVSFLYNVHHHLDDVLLISSIDGLIVDLTILVSFLSASPPSVESVARIRSYSSKCLQSLALAVVVAVDLVVIDSTFGLAR